MPQHRAISFGRFHLDPDAKQLRQGGIIVPLRSKSFAVLWHLACNPGRLVPQDELMRAVWPGTSVGPTVLRVSIREIRAALGDQAHRLVTVPRHGHRFVVDVDTDARVRPFVGRESELAALHHALLRARSGARQVVFVTGDAGVGKSSLVERFLDDVRASGSARIASGQCIDLYDGLEPYAPILDLLARTRTAAGDDSFERLAVRWAPSWLRQLPGRDRDDDVDDDAPCLIAPAGGRLLRELSTLLEAAANELPLVVELQDLHWADASTLDALTHVAQRDTTAALLLVCTRRPGIGPHAERLESMQRQLMARNRCSELRLGMLDASEVESFLVRRLAPKPLGQTVAATLHARTEGHPLFLTALTDHLLAQRQLVVNEDAWRIVGTLDGVIPTAIREMIATSFESVAPEQRRILEAASVAGTTFSAAAISAALDLPIAEVEDACDQLVAERRLAHGGIEHWPDGTTSARYAFLHDMHAEVLYAGLTPAMRSRYHRLVGESVSNAHAGHLQEVAAVLAHHFTLAGDEERAWYAHRQAARGARNGLAAREAIGHLEAALTMIRALPRDEKRMSVELRCLLELGEAAISVHGYAAPMVADAYRRACELSTSINDVASHVLAESGLFLHHSLRGDLAMAQDRAVEILHFSEVAPLLAGTGHGSLGTVLLSRGQIAGAQEAFRRAKDSWEAWPGVALDLRAMLHGFSAICALVMGDVREAHRELDLMLKKALALPFDPLLIAQCHALSTYFHAACDIPERALPSAERAISLVDAHGLPLFLSPRVAYGWAARDAAVIRTEMELLAESGARLGAPQYGALLADTLLGANDVAGAAEALDRAFAAAAEYGENYYLAELHRLRGRCLLLRASDASAREQRRLVAEAQESFGHAMSVASRQDARLFLLRAATDACATAPRPAQARDRLRDLLSDMDDGSETPDLVRARTNLAHA